eukprot:907335-Pleurochrysis_carterae.AAC.4
MILRWWRPVTPPTIRPPPSLPPSPPTAELKGQDLMLLWPLQRGALAMCAAALACSAGVHLSVIADACVDGSADACDGSDTDGGSVADTCGGGGAVSSKRRRDDASQISMNL